MTYHLTVGGDSWCSWTGCAAGQCIADKAGVRSCHYASRAAARQAAAALRPHFRRGSVKVVDGDCPHAEPPTPLRVNVSWRNDNPDTIWNRLAAKLGREPTAAEAKAEVRRILAEPA